MHVDVLSLRYDPARGTLDDTALREFVRDKVILSIRDHFFQVGAVSTPCPGHRVAVPVVCHYSVEVFWLAERRLHRAMI